MPARASELRAEWMAMIPPARSSQRISLEPGVVHLLAPAAPARGKLRTDSGR